MSGDVAARAAKRDYLADMNALIERVLNQDNPDGIVPGVAAASLFHHLQDSDPELLEGFMHASALPLLGQLVRQRISSRRATASRRVLAQAFGAAARTGDADVLAAFRQMHVVNEHGLHKAAADMTGTEHEFVAGRYQRTGDTMLMLAAFHKAVGRKAGRHPVRDVMDAEAYARMYQSIVRKPKGIAA